MSAAMASLPWSEEETDVFCQYILPKSQYAKGTFDRDAGMGWKELAPMMQAEMARIGFQGQRVYTEAVLSQQFYKTFNSRSLSRSERDMPVPMSPLREQPSSRQRAPPRRIHAPARVRLRPGYVTRWTQTDPKEFAGLSTDEALSVHANTQGPTNHDLDGKNGRSKRDDREMRQSEHEIEEYHRNDGGNHGGRKRGYEEYDNLDINAMTEDEQRKHWNSQRKVQEHLHHPSKKSNSILQENIPSSPASYGDDYPAYEDSYLTRIFASGTAQSKNPRMSSSFVLDDFDSVDGSDYGYTLPTSRKEIGADLKARLDSYEELSTVQNEERRKRRKTGQVQSGAHMAIVLDILGDSSDGDIEFIDKDPSRPRAETGGAHDGHESLPVKKGMFVDGIYQPARLRGFSARPSPDQDETTLANDLDSTSQPLLQLSSRGAPAQKKTHRDKPDKIMKASRGSENAPARKKEQKNTSPSSTKVDAIKKSKKSPSKMTNRLPLATSKHPIAYTDRQVPFFESVMLPPISKRGSGAKPPVGKDPVGRGQTRNNGNLRGNHTVRDPNSIQIRQTKKLQAEGDANDRPNEKTVNLGGTIHKISDLPATVKRTFKINADSNIPDSFISKPTPATATATESSPALARNVSSSKEGINEHKIHAKFSTLKSIVASANVETRLEDAAPWAKAIAAGRGYRETASVFAPAAPALVGKKKGTGLEKAALSEK
ncbi:hypothetical protein BKA65DRAFT_587074 [Rhexocercosporidium sp. MPI-PUGE-AT-0058]|nr:hypothetical protein BKA65DRAFT_587074 [Rhexocercosporidium sp. MPI-PUGE-AT-0058]